jgi:hypothetical protein
MNQAKEFLDKLANKYHNENWSADDSTVEELAGILEEAFNSGVQAQKDYSFLERVCKSGICSGCGHLIAKHFKSVDDNVRCLHVSQVTTTGVIMTYDVQCDCVNYVSENLIKEKAEEEKKQKELQLAFDEAFSEIEIKKELSPELQQFLEEK